MPVTLLNRAPVRFSEVCLADVATVDAPVTVSSAELEEALSRHLSRIGMPRGIIDMLSGIKERRFWAAGASPSRVAAEAARLALDAAGVAKTEVGLVINTSVSRDQLEPSTASAVHAALKLPRSCRNFDLGNACLGFVDGLDVAAMFVERGDVKVALVVDGESSRDVVEATIERLNREGTSEDFQLEFATLTLGSGAAAAVVGRSERFARGHAYLGSVSSAATEHNGLCKGEAHQMRTDGTRLLAAGLDLAEQTFNLAKSTFGWDAASIDRSFIHQVSVQHAAKLNENLGLSASRVPLIVREFGNVGPASIPMTLSKYQSSLSPGDRIALMGIGSGLNCTMAELSW